jgi:hypothetical protein
VSWRPERFSPGKVLQWANAIVSPVDSLARNTGVTRPQPVFVVGLPRSGTTLAYELIVQAFDVAYFTRAYAYSYGLPNITTRMLQRSLAAPVPRYASVYGRIPGWRSPAENHVFWEQWIRSSGELGHYVPPGTISSNQRDAARQAVASITAIARRPFVFKDVYLAMSPAALLEIFPDARIVLVERDFDAVCASVLRGRMGHKGVTWWSIRPPFYREMTGKDNIEKTAFQCTRAKQVMDREFSRVPPASCLRVSYDEICSDPLEVLERVETWVTPLLQRRANARIPSSFERRGLKKMSTADASQLEKLCETMIDDRDRYLRRIDHEVACLEAAGGT